jgi:hypothetical protein
MLIILGSLVCWAVIYSTRQILKGGFSAIASVAALCSASLSVAFLFTLDVLINPSPALNALHTDMTGAMVVGAVAMASAAGISGSAALVCTVRKVEGWGKVFVLLAVICACQGCVMFYLLFLH